MAEKGNILCGDSSGLYLLEPYREVKTDLAEEQLYSAEKVTEAVSGEDQVCARDEVSGYQSGITDIYDYQNEKIICDELGIAGGYIQVFTAKRAEASEEDWWDGDIIVLDETHIIMKLYQGWFLLEKV